MALRVALSGGGTGGHIYPALALARGLVAAEPEVEFLYLGGPQGLEARLAPQSGLPFRPIAVGRLERGRPLTALGAGWKVGRGFLTALEVLRRFRPQVVVGTGGYVCAPVMLAASFEGRPTLLHEQNALPGLTNRLLASFVSVVCNSFPEASRYFPPGSTQLLTGLPVRPEILELSREEGARRLGLDPERFTLLVAGGSLGARRLNQAMLEVYRLFHQDPGVQVLHATGPQEYRRVTQQLTESGIELAKNGNISLVPYLEDMPAALAASDLVVSRAGATFLAEVLARGLPSILVPYPFAAENHQEYNARALVRVGAAVMLLDRELTGTGLAGLVGELKGDTARRQQMARAARALAHPEALDQLVGVVLTLARRGRLD